jgi:hypothetical protein
MYVIIFRRSFYSWSHVHIHTYICTYIYVVFHRQPSSCFQGFISRFWRDFQLVWPCGELINEDLICVIRLEAFTASKRCKNLTDDQPCRFGFMSKRFTNLLCACHSLVLRRQQVSGTFVWNSALTMLVFTRNGFVTVVVYAVQGVELT